MAKPNKIPDFRKMYPEADKEVITELRKSERKMQYEEFDLKAERVVKDKETNTITFLPPREESIERLRDRVYSIADDAPGTEEQAIRNICYRQLYRAISRLTAEDRYLINQLYFRNRTERELAMELHLSQKGINKRKDRAVKRLGELMKKFKIF